MCCIERYQNVHKARTSQSLSPLVPAGFHVERFILNGDFPRNVEPAKETGISQPSAYTVDASVVFSVERSTMEENSEY